MQSFRSFVAHARPALALLFFAVAGISGAIAADASDNSAEREALAAFTRQLDLANRLAEQAAAASSGEPARYHFDYARLHNDLQRVRVGVQDYLAPERAQPRDSAPLAGTYSRETGNEPQGRLP